MYVHIQLRMYHMCNYYTILYCIHTYVCVTGALLKPVSTQKYLGVVFDDRL